MPRKLLLADDSVTIQKAVAIVFAHEDIEVIAVANGEDAVARAREIRPDIVLADAVMPGLDGYQVCEALKRDPATADIPVLLLAGTFEPFDENRARAVGCAGHVVKPFESTKLIEKVREVLGDVPAREEAPRPAAPSATAAPAAQQRSTVSWRIPVPGAPTPMPAPTPAAPSARPAGSTWRPAPPGSSPARPPSSVILPRQQQPSAPRPAAPAAPPPAARPPAAAPRPAAPASAAPAWTPSSRAPQPVSGQHPARTAEEIFDLSRGGATPSPAAPARSVSPAFGAPRPSASEPLGPTWEEEPLELEDEEILVEVEDASGTAPAAPASVHRFDAGAAARATGFEADLAGAAARPQPSSHGIIGSPLDDRLEEETEADTFGEPAVLPERQSGDAADLLSEEPNTAYLPSANEMAAEAAAASDLGLPEPQLPFPAAPSVAKADAPVATPVAPSGGRTELVAPAADGGEAALRAAIEGASREVIEKIAWEVVPQLAEVIIREHVERLIAARERGEKR